MDPIIECVPNFSEGRDYEIIQAISTAIKDTEGCTLLDVDPGHSTNRTVYTFVGPPSSVVQGALNAAKVACKLIDMSRHKGEHPRMGALDVCPFIPVTNASMEDCVKCSKEFGQALAEIINVPVYLYEYSSCFEHRKSLPQIRAGEYEGLKDKLCKPEWIPDYGPTDFVPSWGATVTGARKFLIAYNINLLCTKEQAHGIALDLRESGRGPKEPGCLKAVKGLGWYLDEHNIAQVSLNLTDYEITPLHVAFEKCQKNAEGRKLPILGSEIVGVIPLKAMLMTAEYYIEKENLFVLHEDQKIMLAIQRLGLNSLSLFNPQDKIIEYRIDSFKDGPLLNSSVRGFVESLGSRTSAPGGGSASACVASIGAALGSMVGLLTYGNKKFAPLDDIMRSTITPLHTLMKQLLPLVDKDAQAFDSYMEAMKLPKKSDEERERRTLAMQAGLRAAVNVPLCLVKTAHQCWPHLKLLAQHGNIQTMSDLQVSAKTLEAGIYGGHYNVIINLKEINDEQYATEIKAEVQKLLEDSKEQCQTILDIVHQRLQ